jgi:hypothetical protein
MARTEKQKPISAAGRPSKKSSAKKSSAPATKRIFPPEAYDYGGDILPEDVERLRKRAEPFIADGEWKVIDGYVGRK